MSPTLSLVVLAWENLPLTQACVASLRAGTRSSHEVVVVDNGSGPEAAQYAKSAADIAILNESNLGFAAGMNAGLAAATGDYVVFINNDTVFPLGWDTPTLESLEDPSVGIVAPAVTAAGNPVTVRTEPGTEVLRLLPFGEFPSGVVYAMRRDVALDLGGWNEDYPVASAEDLDLCFTVWANGLDILLDTRTLVEHVSQASVKKLAHRGQLYADNLDRFLARWESEINKVPQLPGTSEDEIERNLGRARTAVRWISRMVEARREAGAARNELDSLQARLQQGPEPGSSPWARLRRR